MKKILVIFKTHLDIGFTHLASEVVQKYNEEYIPRAISVGEEISRMGRKEGFVWTTGSWLIYQYLQEAQKSEHDRMCAAIERGIIRWHALPFTLHSEMANRALYQYGLSLSRQLDERFNIQTIGGKYTDIPGHTCAIIPLLHNAGVKLLHIGVNPATMPPDVPDLFRWKAASGEEILVMYNKGNYGEFAEIPGTDTALCFAHTGDNLGPQSPEEILQIYENLYKKYPHAQIRAGDLSDAARAVLPIANTLPVVTSEIGDTWIHGMGTDPKKVSGYRALLRLAEGWDTKTRETLYSRLFMVAEHTWGLDEKTHLNDHDNYSRPAFEAARCGAPYQKMEASWEEQRRYVTEAADRLAAPYRDEANAALAEYCVPYPDLREYSPLAGDTVHKNGWDIRFNRHGAITYLEKNGKLYANAGKALCNFKYEVFSEKEVLEFGDRYITHKFDWALEDLGKIGLSSHMEKYESFALRREALYQSAQHILLLLRPEARATNVYGCPPRLILKITPEDSRIVFDFAWFDKPALRIPEALWLGFAFTKPLTSIQKLGVPIDPMDVVSKGNREMHCTDGLLTFGDISFTTLDAPLFAVGKPAAYSFRDAVADTAGGVWVNLFNNQYGTNFPMWNEGDARFRFVLEA